MFFENSECLRCGTALGFAPDRLQLVALDRDRYVRCDNALLAECNWLLSRGEADDAGGLCRSCKLTRTRPSDTDATAIEAFATTEAAKRRLIFQLLDLGLPVEPYDDVDGGSGLAFDLLSDQTEKVLTGHDDGLITIDVGETNDARRERTRTALDEPYRTMLGHLRHEIGHYYWPVLVAGHELRHRELFGDETRDYAGALDEHYRTGPPADWPDHYVSAYATAHPWEDWAETFAHYLHIRDTLETAAAYGMKVGGPVAPASSPGRLRSRPELDVDRQAFTDILDEWLPLTYALNAVNRSMGRPDLYPFVLSPPVIEKLSFVHDLVARPERPARVQCGEQFTEP